MSDHPTPRLLFCSYHSYIDPGSGAALSTRDLLEMLTADGWPCAVLCGPQMDAQIAGGLPGALRAEGLPFKYRPGDALGLPCTLYRWVRNQVECHAFVPTERTQGDKPTKAEGKAFVAVYDMVQERFRADIVLTYGGHWLARQVMRRVQQKGIKVVFGLHNFNYRGADLFADVDAVLVPSIAAKEHYRKTLGLECTAIPGPWNLKQILCDEVEGNNVTFINPQPVKGVFWFARIVHEMNRRRPDISFLVVEGRGKTDWLGRSGLDMSGLKNLRCVPRTPDPRQFYGISRMVLLPSLWEECFARVAIEAMLNGIPVLASRRGGMGEALADAGFLFDIPERYTQNHHLLPSVEDVEPWLETIIRHWDDRAFHAAESARCREAAHISRPEHLRPRLQEFFRRVMQSELRAQA